MKTVWFFQLAIGTASSIFLLTTGCKHDHISQSHTATKMGEQLDTIRESIDKYGFVTASAPLIIRPEETSFGFGLNKTAEHFYNENRTEGSVNFYDAEIRKLRSSLQFNLEELVESLLAVAVPLSPQGTSAALSRVAASLAKVQGAQQGLAGLTDISPNEQLNESAQELVDAAENMTGNDPNTTAQQTNSGETSNNDPGTTPLDLPPLPELQDVSISPRLAAYSGDLSLSPLERIRLAATEKTTQDILNYMAKPHAHGTPDNLNYYFALVSVSAAPGWKTKTGFAAEVDVFLEYGSRQLDGTVVPSGSKKYPVCVGVYPLMEAQILDLRSALRRMRNEARQTGVSGFGLGAQRLDSRLAQAERDATSLTSFRVTTSMSHAGSSFGFRIEPQYRAITGEGGNLETRGLDASREFSSVAFPALAIIIADKNDVKDSAKDINMQSHLISHVNSRWAPLEGNNSGLTEVEYAELVLAWQHAFDSLTCDKNSDKLPKHGSAWAAMRRRLNYYEHRGLGSSSFTPFPWKQKGATPATPVINLTNPTPVEAWINHLTTISLSGSGLTSANVKKVTVGGLPAEIIEVTPKSIVFVVPPMNPKATSSDANSLYDIVVATTAGVYDGGEVKFSRLHAAPTPTSSGNKGAPKADETVVIERNPDGFIQKVELRGESHEQTYKVLKDIKDTLRDGSSGEKFNLELDAQGGIRMEGEVEN